MEQEPKFPSPGTNPLGHHASDRSVDDVATDPTQAETGSVAIGQEAVALEEEQIKDEIDIQIDLLNDPDWVIRREAVITLGEMGDERCVEPLARALRDGDWQVREVAIDAMGQARKTK